MSFMVSTRKHVLSLALHVMVMSLRCFYTSCIPPRSPPPPGGCKSSMLRCHHNQHEFATFLFAVWHDHHEFSHWIPTCAMHVWHSLCSWVEALAFVARERPQKWWLDRCSFLQHQNSFQSATHADWVPLQQGAPRFRRMPGKCCPSEAALLCCRQLTIMFRDQLWRMGKCPSW